MQKPIVWSLMLLALSTASPVAAQLPDPATYAPRGMGVIAPGKGMTFNGATIPTSPGYSAGNDSGFKNGGTGRNPCWGRNRFCGPTVTLFPAYGFYGWGGNGFYGDYYGSPSYSYQNSQIEDQNYLLRQQIEELRRLNDELRNQNNPNANAARGANVPPADRDKRVLAAQRADRFLTTGTRLFGQGSYYRAAEQFRQSIKQVPNDPTPHFFLAQALFASGKYHEATEAIKDGLAINPNWLNADFDMRSLYKNPADVVSQMADLGKELKRNPLDRNSLFLLGFELFVTGQKEKARAVLQQAARLESDDRHLQPFFENFEAADSLEPAPPLRNVQRDGDGQQPDQRRET